MAEISSSFRKSEIDRLSVYECQRVECAVTSPLRTECGMFVMYCMQCSRFVSDVL